MRTHFLQRIMKGCPSDGSFRVIEAWKIPVGSNGSKICHSALFRSLGYGLLCITIAGCMMQQGYHKGALLILTHYPSAF
jgi:hypothetical protein